MTKFSSFLVFFIGIVLLVIVGVMMVQRFLPAAKKGADAEVVVPESSLPPLIIESKEQFHARLDNIFRDVAGLSGISGFVEREFVPGRVLILAATHKSEGAREFVILDREVRRCDDDGVVLLGQPPVVPRTSKSLHMGGNGVILTWSRLQLDRPFILTTWCVPKRK